MKTKNLEQTSGFTLLELIVVLAILAVITTLATREIGHVQDHEHYLASRRGLEAIESAIIGSPEDRMPDGSRVISGFVADMGRLPKTVMIGPGTNSLSELWANPGVSFDIRSAVQSNGIAATLEDAQILVPCGWRGPYLRLALGDDTVRDGWGNPYISPDASGYARLRDLGDNPLTSFGQEIRIIRHLGANGLQNDADTGYDRDVAITFSNSTFQAGIKGHVEVLGKDNAAGEVDAGDMVSVRVFGPDPAQDGKIRVWFTNIPFASNPVVWEIPASAGLTLGTRVVRAYFDDSNASGNTVFTKSAVKTVTLGAGINFLDLQVDR
jgi:prepilin-type N-terminal cleavage/methylation domain-containing protein